MSCHTSTMMSVRGNDRQSADTTDKEGSKQAETEEGFTEAIASIIYKGYITLGISTGVNLGLFEALAKYSDHKTSHEIADDLGFKERYVREWLGIMASAKIVELDESGKKFFLPRHHRPALTAQEGPALLASFLSIAGGVECELAECFKKDGPAGISYDKYPGMQEWRQRLNGPMAERKTLETRFGMVPGMIEKLQSGCEIVDLGTGPGRMAIAIAEMFPKSTVWGLDISEEGIQMGISEAAERKIKNTKLKVQDICNMPEEWTNKWDFVTMFDVAHDVPFTRKMMREVVRVLKPGGYFFMIDVAMHTEHKDNVGVAIAPMIYTMSLFHCMPVSLNIEGGEGWGAAWGVEKGKELLLGAGFGEVRVSEDFIAICRKAEDA